MLSLCTAKIGKQCTLGSTFSAGKYHLTFSYRLNGSHQLRGKVARLLRKQKA
jgi:hypothetical protein